MLDVKLIAKTSATQADWRLGKSSVNCFVHVIVWNCLKIRYSPGPIHWLIIIVPIQQLHWGVYPVFRHTYMRASWNGSPKPWDSIYTHGRNLDDLEYPYFWKPPIFMYIINGWFSIASSDHWKVELRQECGRDWDIEKKLVSWRIAKSCIPKTSLI